jgi:hypothetical protein
MLCGLPSLHLGAQRIGRRMFLGHGGNEVEYGGLGMSGRRRLQIPEPKRAEVVRHGGKHEEQVVQELRKIPLGNRVFPLSFFVRYDEDVVWF